MRWTDGRGERDADDRGEESVYKEARKRERRRKVRVCCDERSNQRFLSVYRAPPSRTHSEDAASLHTSEGFQLPSKSYRTYQGTSQPTRFPSD